MADVGDGQSLKLYFGGLPYGMRDADLVALCMRFGDLGAATVVSDRMTGRSKGFALAEFRNAADGRRAIDELNARYVSETGRTVYEEDVTPPSDWIHASWQVDADGLEEYVDATEDVDNVKIRIVGILERTSDALAALVADYPRALSTIEWRDFERMLATVFEGLGFAVTRGRGSKDGGIDLLIATQSSTYVVQAKHWVSGKRVGRRILKASVSVAVADDHDGAIVLASSGFAQNAVNGLTVFERGKLRVGGRWEVHTLCRSYISARAGLLYPRDLDRILLAHTRQP